MSDLIAKAKDLQQQAEVGIYPEDNEKEHINTQGGAKAETFPRKYGARDPRDEMMQMKMELMNEQGGSAFGDIYASDQDFRWLKRKQEALEKANFDQWFSREFHKDDLATRRFAQEINPEYYAAREAQMLERAKLAMRVRLMQLRGPQSEEDLKVLYLLNRGLVKLDPDWDRIGPPQEGASWQDPADIPSQRRFKQQLFSLPSLINDDARRSNASAVQQTATRGRNPFGANNNADVESRYPEQLSTWSGFLNYVSQRGRYNAAPQ